MHAHQELTDDFHWAGKGKQRACKTWRVCTKILKKTLKNSKKILRFFDQNLHGKLTFLTFFTNIFLDFLLLSQSIYLGKITPDFYNNFSDFGGDVQNVPTYWRRLWNRYSEGATGISSGFQVKLDIY